MAGRSGSREGKVRQRGRGRESFRTAQGGYGDNTVGSSVVESEDRWGRGVERREGRGATKLFLVGKREEWEGKVKERGEERECVCCGELTFERVCSGVILRVTAH